MNNEKGKPAKESHQKLPGRHPGWQFSQRTGKQVDSVRQKQKSIKKNKEKLQALRLKIRRERIIETGKHDGISTVGSFSLL
ncbi:Histone-Lysine N-Methyltransferase Ash1L [Manis pentadactyla]|nr:Histone-Lysine N-Methyltransferase Ash1L [Manis pentadactyla]